MQLVMGNLIYYFCQLPFKRKTLQHKKYFYFIDIQTSCRFIYIIYTIYYIHTYIYTYIYIHIHIYIYIYSINLYSISLSIYIILIRLRRNKKKLSGKIFLAFREIQALRKWFLRNSIRLNQSLPHFQFKSVSRF